MSWVQVLQDAGLSQREADSVLILSATNQMRASELAKSWDHSIGCLQFIVKITRNGHCIGHRRTPDEIQL